jgi:hypothetical protein
MLSLRFSYGQERLEIVNQRAWTVTSICLVPFMCLLVSRLLWVSSLAYLNLLGTKGYVVVVVVVCFPWDAGTYTGAWVCPQVVIVWERAYASEYRVFFVLLCSTLTFHEALDSRRYKCMIFFPGRCRTNISLLYLSHLSLACLFLQTSVQNYL